MSSLLNGVSPRDPLTFVTVALILLTATIVASWIPAYRATRVDPNAALGCDEIPGALPSGCPVV
jgi:putative ABC transport system permease protein